MGQAAGSVVCAELDVVDDNVVEVDEETLSVSMSPDNPLVTTVTASSTTVTIKEIVYLMLAYTVNYSIALIVYQL